MDYFNYNGVLYLPNKEIKFDGKFEWYNSNEILGYLEGAHNLFVNRNTIEGLLVNEDQYCMPQKGQNALIAVNYGRKRDPNQMLYLRGGDDGFLGKYRGVFIPSDINMKGIKDFQRFFQHLSFFYTMIASEKYSKVEMEVSKSI